MKPNNTIISNIKIITYCLIGALLLFFICYSKTTMADGKTVICGGDVLKNADGSYMTSVEINNNTGIMGYKINLKYNPKEISVKTVTAGDSFKNGTFENNIGVNKGICDVLWAGSNNIKKDGVLFYIKFDKEKGFKKKTEIKLSYSQADTFNEKYKGVKLECKKIEISSLDNLLANTDVEFENTEVKEAIGYILIHNDAGKIVKAVEEIKSLGKDSKHSKDEHEDLAIINDDSATQNILAKLIEKKIDVSKIQTLDNDKQIEAVRKLYSGAKKKLDEDKRIRTLDNKKSAVPFIIIGIVLGCVIIAIIVLIIARRKKDKNENE